MKITIHSTGKPNGQATLHFFDTFIFETPIEELTQDDIQKRIKMAIDDVAGMVIKSIIVE